MSFLRPMLLALLALSGGPLLDAPLAGTAGARAETLSPAQVRCVLGLQAAGGRVARAAVARAVRCVRAAARARGADDFAACMADDRGGRLARAQAKTRAVAVRRCGAPPPIGPADPAEVNAAAGAVLRLAPLLGGVPDARIVRRRDDRAGAACQAAVVRAQARAALRRHRAQRACVARLVRTRIAVSSDELRACLDAGPGGGTGRARAEPRVARACRRADLAAVFTADCRGDTPGAVLACAAAEARCGACLASARAGRLGAACLATPTAPATVCAAPAAAAPSVARQWNEELLAAIRLDFPRPPVHARNLYHVAVAAWDAWAAYDARAGQVIHRERRATRDAAGDRAASISFAVHRVLTARFARSPNADVTRAALRARMHALGFDPDYDAMDDDRPAALGNRIGAAVLAAGLADGAGEADDYADPGYAPVNPPLVVKLPGATMVDPNRWQPLALDVQIGQNGIPIPGKLQIFVGSQWREVLPFALGRAAPGALYLDPGPPPQLGGAGDARFKALILELLRDAAQLTPDDDVRLDISPAGWGNNTLGANDGAGYPLNPVTGEPYAPQWVRRGDFARVLAEFWADGPTSETPPGHWNVVANGVSDDGRLVRRIGGTGDVVDPLEWDVKLGLALNGAMHDAAIQCWGVKRHYDSVRPISMVRYMGGLGQSSDPDGPSYHPLGLPLEPGLVEVVTPDTAAPGARHAAFAGHLGAVVVLAWPGEPADPLTQYSGVRWVRAVEWAPYQRKTFVTPPFAAYPSGHSTFSRAAAEVLTRFTGSPWFPGGLGEYVVPQNAFLRFETGPSEPLRLQWARYYDAADQAGISRRYGGIHVSVDDVAGRLAGATIGAEAFARAVAVFAGTAP